MAGYAAFLVPGELDLVNLDLNHEIDQADFDRPPGCSTPASAEARRMSADNLMLILPALAAAVGAFCGVKCGELILDRRQARREEGRLRPHERKAEGRSPDA